MIITTTGATPTVEISELNLVMVHPETVNLVTDERFDQGDIENAANQIEAARAAGQLTVSAQDGSPINQVDTQSVVVDAASLRAEIEDAKDRSEHVGTQPASTVTGLSPVATSNQYSDLAGTPNLGTAASANAADFATAAQGTLADTAVQPQQLATVAVTGDYNDIVGTPPLGSAAFEHSTAFATYIQGGLADTASQPGTNVSQFVNDAGYITSVSSTEETTVQTASGRWYAYLNRWYGPNTSYGFSYLHWNYNYGSLNPPRFGRGFLVQKDSTITKALVRATVSRANVTYTMNLVRQRVTGSAASTATIQNDPIGLPYVLTATSTTLTYLFEFDLSLNNLFQEGDVILPLATSSSYAFLYPTFTVEFKS